MSMTLGLMVLSSSVLGLRMLSLSMMSLSVSLRADNMFANFLSPSWRMPALEKGKTTGKQEVRRGADELRQARPHAYFILAWASESV